MEQSKELQVTTNSLLSKTEIEFANKVTEILNITQDIDFQKNPMIKAIIQANAMDKINEALTPELMKPVEKLFGSSIGVKTDKTYPSETMKRIFIEATLGGWGIVGNQINVIGGNMYITKQGYLPRLRKIDGLRFTYPFKHQIPIKNEKTGTYTISTEMEWTYEGKSHKEIITYPVKKQEGQSDDALWGKGDTKCCRWLWNKITGQETIDDSGDFVEHEVVETSVNSGQGVQSQDSNVEIIEEIKNENGKEVKEEIKKIPKEFQDKLDAYLEKSNSKEDLTKRFKVWCNSPQAKEVGASFSELENGEISSNSVNLNKFNELNQKFSSAS